MAFTQMAFVPADGLKNTTSFVAQPADETAARKQFQDVFDQVRDYVNNTLLVELESTEADASGASKIGAETVGDLVGNTVQAVLEALDTAIKALSIEATALTTGVVITEFLANLAVTAAKLAADAVETAKIKDANVTTAKIADDAVTQAKIGPAAVGATELADSGVTTNKLAASAVTPTKLDRAYLPIGGGTMTGNLIIPSGKLHLYESSGLGTYSIYIDVTGQEIIFIDGSSTPRFVLPLTPI